MIICTFTLLTNYYDDDYDRFYDHGIVKRADLVKRLHNFAHRKMAVEREFQVLDKH